LVKKTVLLGRKRAKQHFLSPLPLCHVILCGAERRELKLDPAFSAIEKHLMDPESTLHHQKQQHHINNL
jgi:hypothetical protein